MTVRHCLERHRLNRRGNYAGGYKHSLFPYSQFIFERPDFITIMQTESLEIRNKLHNFGHVYTYTHTYLVISNRH